MQSLISGLAAVIRNNAPVPFVGRSNVVWPWTHRNDAETQMKAFGSVGTLFSIVHRTSNATSQVNWKLWRKAKSGNDDDRTEVTSHAALDVWNKPNPFMTRQEFVEVEQQHVDLTGEGWWLVGRNPKARSIPLELWPVRPDRMVPVPHREKFLAGYQYVSPDGERVPLELDQVIFLRMPNPLDPYRGMGPVQAILVDLDSARYSAEWNRNFFINSAEPGGVIELPSMLSDAEWLRFQTRWREQHQGISNAHRVAVIEQGKWVNRAFSMKDMQFAELRSVSRETIREAFGFPKFAAGDVDDVNRAVAEASAVWFAKYLTVPRLERIKGALNNDFLPLFGTTGQGVEFDYEDPTPTDTETANQERESKANSAKTYIDAGFTAESVKEALSLPAALVWEKPEPPPAPPIQAQATVGEAIEGEAEENEPKALPAGNGKPRAIAGDSFLRLVGEFRGWSPLDHLPGKHDQSTHGGGGGVRDVLADAGTIDELNAAASAEAKRITGRDIPFDMAGSDLQVAKDHSEGIMRGLERFPGTTLVGVRTYGPGSTPSDVAKEIARTQRDSFAVAQVHGVVGPDGFVMQSNIYFNNRYAGDPAQYDARLAMAGDDGWLAAPTRMGTATHEFGHVVTNQVSARRDAYDSAVEMADAAGAAPRAFITRQVSEYASTDMGEFAAEAFADVMTYGDDASDVSQAAFGVIESAYKAKTS